MSIGNVQNNFAEIINSARAFTDSVQMLPDPIRKGVLLGFCGALSDWLRAAGAEIGLNVPPAILGFGAVPRVCPRCGQRIP